MVVGAKIKEKNSSTPMARKAEILARAPKDSVIYTRGGYSQYSYTGNYGQLLSMIKAASVKCFFEYISGTHPVTPFFDIDAKDVDGTVGESLLNELLDRLSLIFNEYNATKLVLYSHKKEGDIYRKWPARLIYRLYRKEDNKPVMFKNVKQFKRLVESKLSDLV